MGPFVELYHQSRVIFLVHGNNTEPSVFFLSTLRHSFNTSGISGVAKNSRVKLMKIALKKLPEKGSLIASPHTSYTLPEKQVFFDLRLSNVTHSFQDINSVDSSRISDSSGNFEDTLSRAKAYFKNNLSRSDIQFMHPGISEIYFKRAGKEVLPFAQSVISFFS
ncbi:hypothetical protein [Methanosarcina barkeri]|nr:hypothetical protein [Methanosarcina barkeri]